MLVSRLAVFAALILAAPFALSAQDGAAAATPTPAPTLAQGQQLLQQQQFGQAAAVFESVVASQPSNGQAWFLLGYARHAAGELDAALVGHLKAVELGFNVQGAAYNAACAHALQGDADKAMNRLEQAWRAGFSNGKLLRTDADLVSLAEDPRFAALLASIERTASPEPLALGAISTLGEPMPGIGGGIAVGPDGSLYVADFLTTIYKVTPEGASEVFAAGMQVPSGIAVDSKGRVIQSEFKANRVLRFSPSGEEQEVLATGIPGPVGIAIDDEDRIYVTSCHSGSLWVIEPDGSSRQLAQSSLFQCANGITRDEHGTLYVCNYNDGMVLRVGKDGVVTPLVSIPGLNNGHITYRHGFLWVAGMAANQIFRVGLDGTLELIGGTGAPGGQDGTALSATLFKPNAMAFDAAGTTLYWNGQRGYRGDAASKSASIVRTLTLEDVEAAATR